VCQRRTSGSIRAGPARARSANFHPHVHALVMMRSPLSLSGLRFTLVARAAAPERLDLLEGLSVHRLAELAAVGVKGLPQGRCHLFRIHLLEVRPLEQFQLA
jgi:hypothetical protein